MAYASASLPTFTFPFVFVTFDTFGSVGTGADRAANSFIAATGSVAGAIEAERGASRFCCEPGLDNIPAKPSGKPIGAFGPDCAARARSAGRDWRAIAFGPD